MLNFGTVVSGAQFARGAIGSGPVRASLVPTTIGFPVFFHFNPMKVTVAKSALTEGARGVITNQFEDAIKAVGNLSIKLTDVNFVGYTTKSTCDQLIHWATAAPVMGTGAAAGTAASAVRSVGAGVAAGRAMGGTVGSAVSRLGGGMTSMSVTRMGGPLGYNAAGTIYKLPILLFNWGGGGGPIGLSYRVVMERVSVVYERFNSFGVPVWAKVAIDLKEYPEDLPPTNPTSGGEPGRTKHVVTAGENLVRIATRSYGSPQAWRAVAEANRIDDPLRIRPGALLDLPGPSELVPAEQS
jgi:hypothetical protein